MAEIAVLEDKTSQNHEKLSDCKHYFGYMSEKEHKEQMPEECIMCSQIIECMAKENGSAKEKTQIERITINRPIQRFSDLKEMCSFLPRSQLSAVLNFDSLAPLKKLQMQICSNAWTYMHLPCTMFR